MPDQQPGNQTGRQRKTERQRAEEALDVAVRKVAKLTKDRNQHEAALKAIKAELAEAERIRDYRAQHPALPPRLANDPTI